MEERAEALSRLSPDTLERAYPINLGVFYEKAKPRFAAVVKEPLLSAWVHKNARDPIQDFPWPSELYNSYLWAKAQAGKNGIVAVPSDPDVPTAVDQALGEMGYRGFRVYGTSEAETHFRNSVRAHLRSQTPLSKGSGAQHIGDILRETLDGML